MNKLNYSRKLEYERDNEKQKTKIHIQPLLCNRFFGLLFKSSNTLSLSLSRYIFISLALYSRLSVTATNFVTHSRAYSAGFQRWKRSFISRNSVYF